MKNAWTIPEVIIHTPQLNICPNLPSINCVPCLACRINKKRCVHVPLSSTDQIFDNVNEEFDDGSLMQSIVKNLNSIMDDKYVF